MEDLNPEKPILERVQKPARNYFAKFPEQQYVSQHGNQLFDATQTDNSQRLRIIPTNNPDKYFILPTDNPHTIESQLLSMIDTCTDFAQLKAFGGKSQPDSISDPTFFITPGIATKEGTGWRIIQKMEWKWGTPETVELITSTTTGKQGIMRTYSGSQSFYGLKSAQMESEQARKGELVVEELSGKYPKRKQKEEYLDYEVISTGEGIVSPENESVNIPVILAKFNLTPESTHQDFREAILEQIADTDTRAYFAGMLGTVTDRESLGYFIIELTIEFPAALAGGDFQNLLSWYQEHYDEIKKRTLQFDPENVD